MCVCVCVSVCECVGIGHAFRRKAIMIILCIDDKYHCFSYTCHKFNDSRYALNTTYFLWWMCHDPAYALPPPPPTPPPPGPVVKRTGGVALCPSFRMNRWNAFNGINQWN